MVDIASYRFNDTGRQFDDAYARGNALRTDAARVTAGNALRGGDYAGAAGSLLGVGDLNAGVRVQQLGSEQMAAKAKAAKDHEDEGAKYASDLAGHLADFHAQTKDPARLLKAFDLAAPHLAQYDTPEEVAKLRQSLEEDPEATLTSLGAGAAKKLGLEVRNVGDEVLVIDPNQGGKLVQRYRGARTVNVGEGGALYELPGNYGEPSPATPPAPGGAPAPAAEAAPPAPIVAAPAGHSAGNPAAGPTLDPDAVWKSIHHQESGGDPTPGDAVGPDTAYGNALGSTQMLPATAEAMARKLGIAWNPALMRENSPRALEYQDKLGRAYFDEGLERSGGDPAAAAAYYFAGPNEALHGPKTKAYVEQVLARARVGSQPYEVAALGATPPPPGEPGEPRLLISRPKPTGSRPATVEEKAAYGIAASVPAKIKSDGEIEVISGAAGGLSPKEQRTASIQLRKEFDQQADVKAFQTVATQYDVISRLAKATPNAPNDVSMIFAYMKVLDPTSVVREGEFATAQNTTGIPGRVVNAYNQALSGQRLSPLQRQQFTEAADRIYSANKGRYDQLVSQYQGYSKELGLPDSTIQPRIAVDTHAPAASTKPAPPKVGEVRKGYRYKGGDPALPASWAKAQ